MSLKMLIKKTLVIGEGDGVIGEDGLHIKGWDWATVCPLSHHKTLQSFNVLAHDILEHIGNQTGSIEDELRAFGVILFGRYEQGLIGGVYQSPETTLAYDIADFLTPNLIKPKRYISEETIASIFQYMKEPLTKEFKFTYEDYTPTEEFYKTVIHYLSLGFIQAKRRYKYSGALTHLYQNLQSDLLQELKYEDEYSVKKVYVRIDTDTYDINIRVIRHDYYN